MCRKLGFLDNFCVWDLKFESNEGLSQNVQASAGNPYVAIEGQDGLYIVFHKFDDINVIGKIPDS